MSKLHTAKSIQAVCALLLFVAANIGLANDEIPITPPKTGFASFLIVQKSTTGASTRSPGVYARNASGEWDLLIQGNAVRSLEKEGFVYWLETPYAGGLVVVDGSLHLIRRNSNGSIARVDELGSEKFPLVHGALLAPSTLGIKIQTPEQLGFRMYDDGRGHVILLISVSDGSSSKGKTIAFEVSADPNAQLEAVEIADYAMGPDSLARVAVARDKDQGPAIPVFSMIPQIRRRLASYPNIPQFKHILAGIDSIDAAYRNGSRDPQINMLLWSLPHVSLRGGYHFSPHQIQFLPFDINSRYVKSASNQGSTQWYTVDELSVADSNQQVVLATAFDPLTGQFTGGQRPFNHLTSQQEWSALPYRDAIVSFSRPAKPTGAGAPTFESTLLIGQTQKTSRYLYLIHEKTVYRSEFDLLHGVEPEETSVLSWIRKEGSNQVVYFLMSAKSADGSGRTFVNRYTLAPNESGANLLRLDGQINLSDTFYEQSVLNARLKFSSSGPALFDVLSKPSDDSLEAYKVGLRPSIPYVELAQSLAKGSLSYKALAPVRTAELSRELVYVEFEPTPGETKIASGIYLAKKKPSKESAPKGTSEQEDSVKGLGKQVYGGTMQPVVQGAAEEFLLSNAASYAFGVIGREFYSVNKNSRGAEVGFTQNFLVLPQIDEMKFGGDVKTDPLGVIAVHTMSGKLDDMVSSFGIWANGPNALPVLHSFIVMKVNGSTDVEVYHSAVILGESGGKSVKIKSTVNSRKVMSGPRSAFDPERHLYFSPKGELLIVFDRTLMVDSQEFALRDLLDDRRAFPNQVRGAAKGYLNLSDKKAAEAQVGRGFDYGGGFKKGPWYEGTQYSTRNEIYKQLAIASPGSQKEEDDKRSAAFEKAHPRFFDDWVVANGSRHLVLLVRDNRHVNEKAELWQDVLAMSSRDRAGFSFLGGEGLNPYVFRSDQISVSDIDISLTAIRDENPLQARRRGVLMVDGAQLSAAGTVLPDDPAIPVENIKVEIGGEKVEEAPLVSYLLATQGNYVSPGPELEENLTEPLRAPAIIVATEKEWTAITNRLKERGQGAALSRFQVNYTFFKSEADIPSPAGGELPAEYKNFAARAFPSAEERLIPEILGQARALADIKTKPRKVVLLFQPEIVNFARSLLLTRYLSELNLDHAEQFNFHNSALRLQWPRFSKKEAQAFTSYTQTATRSLLLAARNEEERRVLQVTNLSDVVKVRVPTEAEGGSDFKLEDGEHTPHLIYWIATEGRSVEPEDFSTEEERQARFSSLLIGTREEWDSIVADAAKERSLGFLNDFDVVEVASPSLQAQRELLAQLFEDPRVQKLGLDFSLQSGNDLSASRPGEGLESRRDRLLEYLVFRSANLSGEFKRDPLSMFVAIQTSLVRALLEDPVLQSSTKKVIDKAFVERFLTRVFGIPLNPAILPDDDPLRLIANAPSLARKLQEDGGYQGSMEFRMEIAVGLQAQLVVDPVRNIASSFLVIGDSSSGKTQLFLSLMKTLKLKPYDFKERADNSGAGYLMISGKSIAKGDEKSPGMMTVKEVRAHIEQFLLTPYGYRGYILFDDLHNVPDEVRTEMLGIATSLLEASSGFVTVAQENGASIEVPIRNLNLWITMNRTQDRDKLKRFGAEYSQDVEKHVVATLSTADNTLEASFVKRFNAIITLDGFSSSAKAPTILDSVRQAARGDFASSSRIVLPTPGAIAALVNRFPDANAREFLSSATGRLLRLSPDDPSQKSPIVIIAPRRVSSGPAPMNTGEKSGVSGISNQIAAAIQSEMVAIPVGANLDARLEFLRLLSDNFRIHIYKHLTDVALSDFRLAGGDLQMEALQAPLLAMAIQQMTFFPGLPLANRLINPSTIGANDSTARLRLQSIADQDKGLYERMFPAHLTGTRSSGLLYEYLSGVPGATEGGIARRIHEDYFQLQLKIEAQLADLLKLYSRSIKDKPTGEAWIRGLQVNEFHAHERTNLEASRKVITRILDGYIEFLQAIERTTLDAVRSEGKPSLLTSIDAAYLFVVALDRAMLKLPFDAISMRLQEAVVTAVNDLELGQNPPLQEYLFRSRFSLLDVASPEVMLQTAQASPVLDRWVKENLLVASFDQARWSCEQVLLKAGEAL